jgi:hypothetical protein
MGEESCVKTAAGPCGGMRGRQTVGLRDFGDALDVKAGEWGGLAAAAGFHRLEFVEVLEQMAVQAALVAHEEI